MLTFMKKCYRVGVNVLKTSLDMKPPFWSNQTKHMAPGSKSGKESENAGKVEDDREIKKSLNLCVKGADKGIVKCQSGDKKKGITILSACVATGGRKGGGKESCGNDKAGGASENVTWYKPDPSRCDVYDSRKFSPCLPKYDTLTPFEPLPNIPTGVFRCTNGERRLGPCAAKCWYYQNPEYFTMRDMTFFDFHLILRGCRMASPKSGRKP